LREDRRHIQDEDVYALRKSVRTRLNLEMAVSPEIVGIALDVNPDEVCLVPEKREELTTEGGLDVVTHAAQVREAAGKLGEAGMHVSLFIDPERPQIDATAGMGVPCIELHTGRFCDTAGDEASRELDRLVEAARYAHGLGIQVNAGHGISLDNIEGILQMPYLDTLNIGHSIVAHAVFVGLKQSVADMLGRMAAYAGGRHE
jgi:pyridoxine 5-phosphate synthase